jgi:PAS domain S-box-containing protein
VARVSSSLALAKARREAAGILRESEERFTQFMRHFPGLAWIKDLEGRYVFVNQATVVAAGVAEHEVLGRRDTELMPPDQRRRAGRATSPRLPERVRSKRSRRAQRATNSATT